MTDPKPDPAARLATSIEELLDHNALRMQSSVGRMLFFTFLRGLALGLGTVIGASILVSFLVLMLAQVEVIPVIGDWARDLIDEIESARQR